MQELRSNQDVDGRTAQVLQAAARGNTRASNDVRGNARASNDARGNTRQCIATGVKGEREHMLRFVAAPDGTLVLDLSARLPGRGLWVQATRDALNKALTRNLFVRAHGAPLKIAPTLVDDVSTLLRRRCLQTLGLVRRAGELELGYENVLKALGSEKILALILAGDASAQTAEAMRAKRAKTAPQIPLIERFDRNELSLALGRANVVHAALTKGGLSLRFLEEFARFEAITPVFDTASAIKLAPKKMNEGS